MELFILFYIRQFKAKEEKKVKRWKGRKGGRRRREFGEATTRDKLWYARKKDKEVGGKKNKNKGRYHKEGKRSNKITLTL